MRYLASIHTDAYKPLRCSPEKWEPGTTNSMMKALNGWHSLENDLQEVEWRIEMFLRGESFHEFMSEAEKEKYSEWIKRPQNLIRYMDLPCGVERVMRPECPPWHQGYCAVDKLISKVKEHGAVTIPFRCAYDNRQYVKNMDNCFMTILAIS